MTMVLMRSSIVMDGTETVELNLATRLWQALVVDSKEVVVPSPSSECFLIWNVCQFYKHIHTLSIYLSLSLSLSLSLTIC